MTSRPQDLARVTFQLLALGALIASAFWILRPFLVALTWAWGTGFLVWTIFCLALDNLMRPLLIKRGANLPLLLIFGGVIGGIVAFGILGLFIGPVVLAVAYTLLADWVSRDEPSAAPGVAS